MSVSTKIKRTWCAGSAYPWQTAWRTHHQDRSNGVKEAWMGFTKSWEHICPKICRKVEDNHQSELPRDFWNKASAWKVVFKKSFKTCNNGEDLEAETVAARTVFDTASFPVASRPSRWDVAKHSLWWTPGAAWSEVGHCQYRAASQGPPPRGECVRVGTCVSTALWVCDVPLMKTLPLECDGQEKYSRTRRALKQIWVELIIAAHTHLKYGNDVKSDVE